MDGAGFDVRSIIDPRRTEYYRKLDRLQTMENLSLSVPDLLQARALLVSPPPCVVDGGLRSRKQTVKNFVTPDKHEALDEMLKR